MTVLEYVQRHTVSICQYKLCVTLIKQAQAENCMCRTWVHTALSQRSKQAQ